MFQYCEEHKGEELMTAFNLTQGNIKRQRNRVCLYHFFRDVPLPHESIIRKIIIGGSKLFLKYIGVRRNAFLTVNEKQWDVYFSSQWFSLTGKCAAYVLEQLNNNKTLENYFKTTYAPDELVVTTIVMNSEFRTAAHLIDRSDLKSCSMSHYINYTDYIWTYDEHDYDSLMQSNKLFVRKLISNKSEKLIEMINNHHNQEIQEAQVQ